MRFVGSVNNGRGASRERAMRDGGGLRVGLEERGVKHWVEATHVRREVEPVVNRADALKDSVRAGESGSEALGRALAFGWWHGVLCGE